MTPSPLLADLAPAAGDGATAATLVVLSVTAGSQDFVIDAGVIREIRGWSPPVPLPGAPAYVQGMSDLRGEVMLLICLASRLGLGGAPSVQPVTVVLEGRDGLVGLVVDAVSDLHSVIAGQLKAVPDTGLPTPAELLRGVVEIEGRLLGLVAVEQIIPTVRAEVLAKGQSDGPLMSVGFG